MDFFVKTEYFHVTNRKQILRQMIVQNTVINTTNFATVRHTLYAATL